MTLVSRLWMSHNARKMIWIKALLGEVMHYQHRIGYSYHYE